MGVQPKIATGDMLSFQMETCSHCKKLVPSERFIQVRSKFFPNGRSNICNNCLKNILAAADFSWDVVDEMCRYCSIPFLPKEVVRLQEINGEDFFPIYASIFLDEEYEGLDWKKYYDAFKELEVSREIERELPRLDEKRRENLIKKWGGAYDDDAFDYLESLLSGLLSTQNINGALQMDQALKICKISYELDSRLRAGQDFDKMLASYDKLVKTAEFTPKNTKNASDFDSVGELIYWLEKRGWVNKYYDDVTRDIVDETIKNIQNYNQRLYTNESGIGDEISRRLEALKSVNEMEKSVNFYGDVEEYDQDAYDSDGYDNLMHDEFNPEMDGDFI